MTQSTGFIRLEDRGLLAVRGPDAARFLQGQLTCNLNYVSHDRSSLGARCNPKGRMQSSFRLVQQGDGYLLAMSADLIERQLTDLKKFAVFSKSTLSDESNLWTCYGLIRAEQTLQNEFGISLSDETGSMVQHNNMLALRVGPELCELWVNAEQASCTEKSLLQHLQPLTSNDWQLELIRCGTGHISDKNFENFIPQMINLPAQDGVSFKKGCYTGQEIVARMQYLGTQKRQMFRYMAEGSELPATGTALVTAEDDRKVGEVITAARSTTGIELLAVTQVDALEQVLCLESSSQPLQLAELPYTPDVDRELTR